MSLVISDSRKVNANVSSIAVPRNVFPVLNDDVIVASHERTIYH